MYVREIGKVADIKDNTAIIKIQRRSSCGSCTACGMRKDQNEILLPVSNDLGAKLGDWVELELQSISILKASTIVYVIPLIALILGVIGGYAIAEQLSRDTELYGAIGGILLTILSFVGIRVMDPLFNTKGDYSPRMVSIINLSSKGEIEDGK
jgi:sigma-E factor negative regulatory protein RseC